MFHRDGRYDYKGRDGEQGNKDKPSRKNRWDDKGSGSDHSSNSLTDRRREESKSGTNWETKVDRDNDRQLSSNSSRSRDRSRSRSPFQRNFRDCANPTKDEYKHQNDVYNHSSKQTHDDLSNSSRKNASWSDSSDEDDRSGKSNSNAVVLDYGSINERKHQVPSTTSTHNNIMQPLASGADIGSSSSSGISLKLGGSSTKPMPFSKVISVPISAKSSKVAAIFNAEDDDEPEEMPPECKMRMKNVGRETKTSEGPNSFGKTKIGFCNMSHLAEKRLGGKAGAVKKP